MKLLYRIKHIILKVYNFVKPFKDDRLNLFIFISIFLVIAYSVKLLSLSYFNRNFWIDLVEKQFKGAIKISSERGTIFDRNGVPLATSERVVSFYIRPSEAKNKKLLQEILLRNQKIIKEYLEKYGSATSVNMNRIAQKLKPFSLISINDLNNAYKKQYTMLKIKGKDGKSTITKVPFVWLKKDLFISRKEAFEAVSTALRMYYTLSGENRFKKEHPDLVGYVSEFQRVYPYSVGSTVIGVANKMGEGLSGLEKFLERKKIIMGDTALLSGPKDARGRVYLGEGVSTFLTRKKGNNVLTTIDGNIQYIFEKTLKNYGKEWHPEFINAVLMNPYTGEILAAATYPFYEYGEKKGKNFISNLNPRFITVPYEPGSVIKPIVLAAAINEGILTKDSIIDCPASYEVYPKVFHNEFHGKNVKIRAWQVIQYSDDVGIIKIAQKLGKSTYYRYLKAFGFGNKTGVELYGESSGWLSNWKTWKKVDFATLSFGHDISVTTLQLAAAYSALINGGYYLKPKLLSAIVDDKGNVLKQFPSVIERRVISKRTSEEMRRVLTMVVEGGTGSGTKFQNFYVGGKTGTARIYILKAHAYSKSQIAATFAGAFPMTEPRYVLVVSVYKPKLPKNMLWASKIAVPIFKDLAERVLLYERVPPDKKEYILKRNGEIVSKDINQDFILKNGIQPIKGNF